MRRIAVQAGLGQRIRERREALGLSQPDVWRELHNTIPVEFIPRNPSSLSRIENDELGASALLIGGIAQVLDCRTADLSETAAAELDSLRDLLKRKMSCSTTGI